MEYRNLDVEDFAQYIRKRDVQLLDVRTPEEYREMHISGAVNVDWLGSDFISKAEQIINRSFPVAVYCRSGRRSEDAGRELASKGYNVVNLEGGILAWVSTGQPVVK